jgi:hypothetical protein
MQDLEFEPQTPKKKLTSIKRRKKKIGYSLTQSKSCRLKGDYHKYGTAQQQGTAC